MVRPARLIGLIIVASLCAHSVAIASWTVDGTPVCPAAGDPISPLIISDEHGGAIIAWTDYRSGNADIYAQRIDLNGELLWGTDGLPVCTDSDTQTLRGIAPDGSGGVILVWEDARTPAGGIYAQSVSAAGTVRWTSGGVPVCTSFSSYLGMNIAAAGAGEAIIGWMVYRNDEGIDNVTLHAQRLTATGLPAWMAEGVLCASIDECCITDFNALSDYDGGAIFICRGLSHGCIWGQRIDHEAVACWGPNGTIIGGSMYDPFGIAVATDGFGGALAVYRDLIRGGKIISIDVLRIQRITHDGTVLWSPRFYLDCPEFHHLAIAPDGAGGAIAVWESQYCLLKAQRLDADGSVIWGSDIILTPTVDWYELLPKTVSDGSGGVVVTWMDREGEDNLNIYSQRIDENGILLWGDGVTLCSAPGNQTHPAITTSCAGGAIVAWMDGRTLTQDELYAQTVDAEGQPGEAPVAVLLEEYSATAVSSGIEVRWRLSVDSEESRFELQKSHASSGSFESFDAPIEREGSFYLFIDREAVSGESYRYRVTAIDETERRILFETDLTLMPSLPLALYQNYPNPFNPYSRIAFSLPERSHVVLEILDINGKKVRRLIDGEMPAGFHVEIWHGLDDKGNQASSGVYFYRLRAGKTSISKKMILLR